MSGPPPPPPPPVAPAPPPPPPVQSSNTDRSALLNSIQGFSKNKLKKAVTRDASSPMTVRTANTGNAAPSNGAPSSGRGPSATSGAPFPPQGAGKGGYGLLASLGSEPMPKLRSVQKTESHPVRGSFMAKTVSQPSAPPRQPPQQNYSSAPRNPPSSNPRPQPTYSAPSNPPSRAPATRPEPSKRDTVSDGTVVFLLCL